MRENTYRYSAAKRSNLHNEAKDMVYCSYLQQGTLTLSMFLHFCTSNFSAQCLEAKSFNFELTITLAIFMKFSQVILTQVWVRQKYNFVSFRRPRLSKNFLQI